MNREQAHIGCIDGGVLEVRWHSGEVALVSGNTKVRLSTEAAANLGGMLVVQPTPRVVQPTPRREISSPRPSRGNRENRTFTDTILGYVTDGRPQIGWKEIAARLNRDGIRTGKGKEWTGQNLKCAFERYVAATSSRYGHLL